MSEALLQRFLKGEFAVHIHSNEEANTLTQFANDNLAVYHHFMEPYSGRDYWEYPYVAVEDEDHCNGYKESRVQRTQMAVIEFADLYEPEQQFNIDLEEIL